MLQGRVMCTWRWEVERMRVSKQYQRDHNESVGWIPGGGNLQGLPDTSEWGQSGAHIHYKAKATHTSAAFDALPLRRISGEM